jgi:hypothetical protein
VTATTRSLVAPEIIERGILLLRRHRVMLDEHLAALYDVEVKVFNQAVKRNRERFPDDFMFQLTAEETRNLRSQTVTSSSWGGRRTRPYAFTEQGVAMLSSVLRSPRAIQVNIEIMRSFVRLRRLLQVVSAARTPSGRREVREAGLRAWRMRRRGRSGWRSGRRAG